MIDHFPQFMQNVTLLGGGKVSGPVLNECLALAPDLVAADGGADQAVALGQLPLAVVGDMDSITPQTRAQIGEDRIFTTPDQMRTDFDKALELIEAPLVLCAGFMGGRLDHELACYNGLVKQPEKRAILVGEVDICFHLNRHITLDLPIGTRLSLFPMAQLVAQASGLLWPVEQLPMAPWGMTGTSNEVTADQVVIEADGPGLLVILPRAVLGQVAKAVTD